MLTKVIAHNSLVVPSIVFVKFTREKTEKFSRNCTFLISTFKNFKRKYQKKFGDIEMDQLDSEKFTDKKIKRKKISEVLVSR